MKRFFIFILLLAAMAVPAVAQEDLVCPTLAHEIQEEVNRDSSAIHLIDTTIDTDSLSLDKSVRPYFLCSPWSLGGYGMWSLHEGLNANVGFSITAGLGKHSPRGVGFGEHFAAAYATSFGKDKRWFAALGFYANRFDWDRYHNTEAGLAGLLGYNLNDWCSLYTYGTYNFMPASTGNSSIYTLRYGAYPMGYGLGSTLDPYAQQRGRVGAAVDFKVGDDSFWACIIGIALECVFQDKYHAPNGSAFPSLDSLVRPFDHIDTPKSAGGGGNWTH